MALNPAFKKELLAIIHHFLPSCKVYLFGSRARDEERMGSDIDIALDAGAEIPYDTIIAIAIAIDETTIPMKVDLVDLSKAPEALAQEILREGILWTN